MKKEDLLVMIAEAGYNVGYGAKKHFATFDITAKVPGLIAWTSTAVGVFSLLFDFSSKKILSAAFIVLGLMGLRIGMWDHKKKEYAEKGERLTMLFNRLKKLYYQVKDAEEVDLPKHQKELTTIQNEYSEVGASDQMILSDWYAHYKFFWQQQIGWIEESRKFTLLRDKIPLSFSVAVVGAVFAVISIYVCICGQ